MVYGNLTFLYPLLCQASDFDFSFLEDCLSEGLGDMVLQSCFQRHVPDLNSMHGVYHLFLSCSFLFLRYIYLTKGRKKALTGQFHLIDLSCNILISRFNELYDDMVEIVLVHKNVSNIDLLLVRSKVVYSVLCLPILQ